MAEDTTPAAPAEAPKTPESVADNSTNTNPAPAQVPDMHGFTSEQLADMKKFFDNNGGFDGVKAKISNPTKVAEAPAQVAEPQKQEEPASHTQAQPVEQTQQPLPKGARTNEDLMAEYYFRTLSEKPEYAAISEDIRMGNVLKEMDNLGINYRYPNGAWNDERINDYLKLKAQTVPAKPTESEPNASAAPTVTYTEVGDNITDINQAYQVLMEKGHPASQKAEEFIKNYYSKSGNK